MADQFKACSVDGCNRPSGLEGRKLNGYCYAHYTRWYKTGSVRADEPIKERFNIKTWFENLKPSETDDCVIWPFHRMQSGYPGRAAHRKVCEIFHGPPPTDTHQAAHSCGKGNKGCVNDRHLSWKTPKENTDDQLIHGTRMLGSKNHRATLVEAQVAEIKSMLSMGIGPTEIANIFGVSRHTIQFIKSGKNWRHV